MKEAVTDFFFSPEVVNSHWLFTLIVDKDIES